MKLRAIIVLTAQAAALLFVVWLGWVLVWLGFPLQWLAIGVGGTFAGAAALSFLVQPLFDRALPDLDAKWRAQLGYSVPRPVRTAIHIAYIVFGGAAVVWGLVTLPG